jgi:hypothetical protein
MPHNAALHLAKPARMRKNWKDHAASWTVRGLRSRRYRCGNQSGDENPATAGQVAHGRYESWFPHILMANASINVKKCTKVTFCG